MSGSSGINTISRKRGRPPNRKFEKEASLFKRLRLAYDITKDIRIILKKCDDAKQLKTIDLLSAPPQPILEVDGAITSPSSSLSSFSPPLLRHRINGTIRPNLKSKTHKTMAPTETSSPRSSKRLQKANANPTSNGVGGVEKGNSSCASSSSGAPPSSSSQVSPKRKLSRYPQRLRSTRSRSGSIDTGPLPVEEEKSKSIEPQAISKSRRIKKKIIESESSSPPTPTKVPTPPPSEAEIPPPPSEAEIPPPPSEAEIPPHPNKAEIPPPPREAEAPPPLSEAEIPPPPNKAEMPSPPTQGPSRKKKRRLPASFRSRSNSKNDNNIMEEDNESLTPLPTTVVSNGLQTENEILGSESDPRPPTSPPPAKVSSKRKRGKVVQSRSPTPPKQDEVPPLQNGLPLPPPVPEAAAQDKVIDIISDEDSDSQEIEILYVSPLAHSNFLKTRFSTPAARVAYYCCVMWDVKILNELQCHEDSDHRLYVASSIGKLLSESLINEGHTFPGVAHMDWKKKFILLDIIDPDFRKIGIFNSLRVQEKASIDTLRDSSQDPPQWDLIFSNECKNLGKEMVRMHRSGVKTTVIIWGAHISNHTDANRVDGTEGELFLMPTKSDSEPLSVIIFHHEILSHQRFRVIQDAQQGSELWPNFQNPQLNHRLFLQADLVHMQNPTHLTLHAEKLRNPEDYRARFNNVNVNGAEMEDDDDEVNEFPEVESSDEEDFEMMEEDDDDFNSLYPENPDVDDDDWDDLESASCLGVGSGGENGSSQEIQTSASQDVVELAAKIFRRSNSVPVAVHTAPGRSDVHDSPPGRSERRTSNGESEGAGTSGGGDDRGGAGAAQVVSDSQKKFLLTQELVDSDDEEDVVDSGNGPNELEKTVLTCDEDFVTGDEGPSHSSSPLRRAAKLHAGTGTKDKKGSNQTNLCNGYGPSKGNLSKNGNGPSTSKDAVRRMNGNGSEEPPPSNSEHSEYNFSALLQEF